MTYQEQIERILDFERCNEEILMSGSFKGKSFYPLIRWQFLSRLTDIISARERAHSGIREVKGWKRRLFISVFQGLFKFNPFFSNGADIMVFSDARRRTRLQNGKHFDTIHDPLIEASNEDALVWEGSYQGSHKLPIYSKRVVFSDPMILKAKMSLKRNDELEQVANNYSSIINEAAAIAFSRSINERHGRAIVSLSRYAKLVTGLIREVRPRLAIFLCGSYGGFKSYLIKECKEMGIVTAEFQHGYVGKYHLAYNYSLNGEEYSSYLPDYYLTYGQYWKDQLTRFPNQTVVIGNPELKFQLSERQNMTSRDEVLIVSQGTVTSRLVELAKELRKKLPSKITMVYRLHPGEVPFEDRYNSLYSIDGIIVDKESNIFDLIKRSKAVVGFNSTTLFEALPFEKPIYVMKDSASDAYIPKEVGKRFTSADELADLILSNSVDHNDDDWKYYWELDWEPRFKEFLSMIGLK